MEGLENTKRIQVRNIPKPVHKALKQIALDKETSINNLILTILENYCKTERKN
jgi:predicted HicB family RNase H-like nuclease